MYMPHSFILLYRNNRYVKIITDVALFCLITVAFHFLWWQGLKPIVGTKQAFLALANGLAHNVFICSRWILVNFTGIVSYTEGNTFHYINNGYISVVESCSGLKQFYQIIILYLLFPGPWKHKLWYIPACIIVMHLFNILRIIGLSYTLIWVPEHWDYIHLSIFRPMYYAVIFLQWVFWNEKIRNWGKIIKAD
jgi:exosortase/archaeosortase family protein